MREMSQTKDKSGSFNGSENLNRTFKPRKGQKKVSDTIVKIGNGKFLAELPGGYGKTDASLLSYIETRKHNGNVNRFLYVAPGTQKVNEFSDDLTSKLNRLGYKALIPNVDNVAPLCKIDGTSSLFESKNNTYEFYGVTIQKIAANPTLLEGIMSYGNWFVVVDESHHYIDNKDKPWSDAINGLSYSVMLGLSATPGHREGLSTFQEIDKKRIITVTLKDAYKEESIRKLHVKVADYYVDIEENNDIIRMKLSDIDEMLMEKGMDITRYEVSSQLRYLNKYVSPIIADAVDIYDQRTDTDSTAFQSRPPHQIIVFTSSVYLAKITSKMINDIYGINGKKFSEYVGTGDHGRSDYDNVNIIKEYRKGNIPCLVQVSMAGEGFDNPPSSIIVYLSLKYSGNQVIQEILRIIRRNYMISEFSDDYGIVLLPSDSKAIKVAEKLRDLILPDVEIQDPRTQNDEPSLNLKPFDAPQVKDAELIDIKEINKQVEQLMNRPDIIKIKNEMRITDTEKRDEVLQENLLKALTFKESVRTEEYTKEKIKTQMEWKTKRIARYVGKLNNPKGLTGGYIGDIKKAVYSAAKRYFGKGVTNMTMEELVQRDLWIVDLGEQIEDKKIPLWLNL